MYILRHLYRIWFIIAFFLPLIVFLPLFYWAGHKPERHGLASWLNKQWARIFYLLCFIPNKIEYREKPQKDRNYIYCANHTSWLDIPTLGLLIPGDFIFVGKASLRKIPIFGPVYERIHITLNRENPRDAVKAYKESIRAIRRGQHLVTFPEGGIVGDRPPVLNDFKDGPFRMAIETQTPIVPVSILYNWKILKKGDNFLPRWHRGKAIVQPPISVEGYDLASLPALKEKVFQAIEQDLKPLYPEQLKKA